MKKNYVKKTIMVMLVFLLIISTVIPAYAASATVKVRFVVKNQQGPYKNVGIQFGKNTKDTGKNGTAEFKLKNIPVKTMVSAHLVDPNVPAGYFCDVNLALGAHEDVKVNSTGPASCSLNIVYTEHTDTIIIEYFVAGSSNYGYSNATFKHKKVSSPAPPPPNPKPQGNPAPAPQPKGDPNPPPEGPDPDMPPEEFHEDMPPEEFHEDMPLEKFHEDMPPEEFHEDMHPKDEYYGEPSFGWMIPGYVWIIILGVLLFITGIILIIVLARKK